MKRLLLALFLAAVPAAAHAAVASCAGMLDGTPCAVGNPCSAGDLCIQGECVEGRNVCTDGGVPNLDPLACKPTPVPDGGDSRLAGGAGNCAFGGGAAGRDAGELVLLAMPVTFLFLRRRRA